MTESSASRPFENARFLDRPRIRNGSSVPEIAIFQSAEKLLEEHDFADLSVSQIIRDAGVSRATFYHYFSSKLGIISGLLAQVMDEMFDTAAPFLTHEGGSTITDSLRVSMQSAMGIWAEHRTLLRTVSEHFATDAELEGQWLQVMSRFIEAVAVEIDERRDLGALPPGRPAAEIASALCWGSERCLYIVGRGRQSSLDGEDAAVETLVALWVGALYTGTPDP